MVVLAAALVWATSVTPGWSALGFGLVLGAAGGSVRTLEAATVPRVFGTRSLGAVRGLLAAFSVGSTAFGPVLFAVVRESSGGYGPVLVGAAALPLLVAVAALKVPTPTPGPPVRDDAAQHGTSGTSHTGDR